MIRKFPLFIFIPLIFSGMSCSQPAFTDLAEDLVQPIIDVNLSDQLAAEDFFPALPSTGNLIQPDDFTYLGFFRLPDGSGGSDWDYSGHGLTYFPDGDPEGSVDGFPGSLFGFGHDHQLFVSEINIPEPVITTNLEEANTAQTLQTFADLSGGIFNTEGMSIPRAGPAYLAEPQPRLHFTFGQHIQDFEESHGWANLNLSNPDA